MPAGFTESNASFLMSIHIFVQFSFICILAFGIKIGSQQVHKANSCNLNTKMAMEKHGIVFLDEKAKRHQTLLNNKQPLLRKEKDHARSQENQC